MCFFLLKGITLSVWETKDINIGGSNQSRIDFANIGSQIKFIDTLKYYQQNLLLLTAAVTKEDKKLIKSIEELNVQFLIRHDYFGLI